MISEVRVEEKKNELHWNRSVLASERLIWSWWSGYQGGTVACPKCGLGGWKDAWPQVLMECGWPWSLPCSPGWQCRWADGFWKKKDIRYDVIYCKIYNGQQTNYKSKVSQQPKGFSLTSNINKFTQKNTVFSVFMTKFMSKIEWFDLCGETLCHNSGKCSTSVRGKYT